MARERNGEVRYFLGAGAPPFSHHAEYPACGLPCGASPTPITVSMTGLVDLGD